mgnify:CR=1 FL=1
MLFQKKYLIGQELVRRSLITQDDLDMALIEHERKGEKLGKILVAGGFISEDDLLTVLSDQLSLPIYRIHETEIDNNILERIPKRIARKYKVIPVAEDNTSLTICMSEPLEQKIINEIQENVDKKISVVMDSDKHLVQAVRKYYGLTEEDDL